MKYNLSVKKDFPIFESHPRLSYLDSTATSLKPQSVIDALMGYYSEYSANVHRGIYEISERATAEFEGGRQAVADFIGSDADEVVFTRGATEGLNLLSHSLGRQILSKGDEVITTIVEHHSNFVPWQQVALEKGATFKVAMIDPEGHLVDLERVVTSRTKIVAVSALSNVLGLALPIAEIVAAVRKINPGVVVIVDAAQAAPHTRLNVSELGCDALVFSGHKMCGPTGIGVMWAKKSLLDMMTPYHYGGEMIQEVYLDRAIFGGGHHKFEAGTPHVAGAIGLGAAVRYLEKVGLDKIHRHEMELADMCIGVMKDVFGKKIHILNDGMKRSSGIVTFNLDGVHPHDIAQLLDGEGVAVRAGHHCAMPLHTHFGLSGSARASFYLYNTEEDVQKLVHALQKARKLLA